MHIPYSRPSWRAALPLLCLSLLLSGCGKDNAAKAPGAGMALPVSVIEARPTLRPVIIEAVGQAEGIKDFEVRARVEGILEQQIYAEGETVKAGAPLFRIEPTSYQAEYDAARAALEQAQRETARLKPLLEHRAVSQKEYDDALTARVAADAREREARLKLSYATVRAPFGGVTGRAHQSLGTLVSPTTNSLLTTITQTDPIRVRFAFSEAEYLRFRHEHQQAVARIILADGSEYKTTGRLDFAGATVDPRLGTVQLRAEFANPEQLILPGQFVRLRVAFGRQSVVAVPQAAVMQSEQGHFVWVAGKDGKAVPRPVATGEWQGGDWLIRDGLQAGDKVIVDNHIKLRPGSPVQPHPPQPPVTPGVDKPAGQAG